MRLAPSINRAWNGDALHSLVRHRRDTSLLKKFNRKPARSPTTGIQPVELASLGLPINEEQVAAYAVHHRLRHAKNGVGSNRRINRRPPATEDLRPSLRRKILTRSRNAILSDNHGAAIGSFLGGSREVSC